MVGVSPFKGRPMDEILDAEYKVVEHQIAPPLGPLSALAISPVPCKTEPAPQPAAAAGVMAATPASSSIKSWRYRPINGSV